MEKHPLLPSPTPFSSPQSLVCQFIPFALAFARKDKQLPGSQILSPVPGASSRGGFDGGQGEHSGRRRGNQRWKKEGTKSSQRCWTLEGPFWSRCVVSFGVLFTSAELCVCVYVLRNHSTKRKIATVQPTTLPTGSRCHLRRPGSSLGRSSLR